MSTLERRQPTHMLAGLGGIATPQMQHSTVPTVCDGTNMPDADRSDISSMPTPSSSSSSSSID